MRPRNRLCHRGIHLIPVANSDRLEMRWGLGGFAPPCLHRCPGVPGDVRVTLSLAIEPGASSGRDVVTG